MITIVKLQNLFGDLSSRGMEQALTEWEMLVGFSASAGCAPIVIASGPFEIDRRMDRNHVVVEAQVEKNRIGFGRIYFAFQTDMVVEIIGEVLTLPESAKKEKARSGLSKTDVETFQEVANLLCGAWDRALGGLDQSLSISHTVNDLRVSPSRGDKSALVNRIPNGRVAWIDTKIRTGNRTYTAMIVLPFDVAVAVAEVFYGTTDPRSATAG